MRVYVIVTLEEDLYPTELSSRGIGGRAYRKPRKNIFRSVISFKDMPLTSISQEGFEIRSLARGSLPNGA